jgi:hypothetical protein
LWRRNQSGGFRLWLSFRNRWLRGRFPLDLRFMMDPVDLNWSKFGLRGRGDGLRDHGGWLFDFGFRSRGRGSWLAN